MTERDILDQAEAGIVRKMLHYEEADALDRRDHLQAASWFATVALAMRAALEDKA